jgi:hypothetical protein
VVARMALARNMQWHPVTHWLPQLTGFYIGFLPMANIRSGQNAKQYVSIDGVWLDPGLKLYNYGNEINALKPVSALENRESDNHLI